MKKDINNELWVVVRRQRSFLHDSFLHVCGISANECQESSG